jgi:hypothetical protein
VTIHARTATHLGRPENMNACLRFLRDDVVPTILSMPRCVGLSVLADHRSGHCIITTAWETSEAMHASVARIRPLRDQTSKIMHSSVDLEEWQIAAMHRKHPAGTPVGAQVTWLRVDPGDTDAMIDDYVRHTQPALDAIRGFCSASLLVNREWGRAAITVSYDNPDAITRFRRADGRTTFGTDIIKVRDFDHVMPHLRVPDLASY